MVSQCLKITQNVAFFTNFCPFKTGNTVWPQASGFQKFAKMHHCGNLKMHVKVARFARNDTFSVIFKHCVSAQGGILCDNLSIV